MANTKQRRHFMHTVWHGHVGMDRTDPYDQEEILIAYQKHWNLLEEQANDALRYAVGQLEVDKDGHLHIQCYTEWTRSFREAEVAKRWPSSVQMRNESRESCVTYCKKRICPKHGHVTKILELPTIGKWRDDPHDNHRTSLKQRAIELVVAGRTPEEIARDFPEVYFTHGARIKDLARMYGWEEYGDTLVIPDST